jgi:glyoxylase-like metal-dependent hydrolase (beta-lactamase superfamily II)
MVCHVLLIETGDGLVLIDSGFGLADIAAARDRLGGAFVGMLRLALDPAETARQQVEGLGYTPEDVRDIVLTHLDLDHAGGIADFPHARIHVLAQEHEAARAARSLDEKMRYKAVQWSHGPTWSLCRTDGESSFGFPAVRELEGLPPEILMIPLTGHSRGHAGVAINTGDGWLLHAGDAYFHAHEMDANRPRCPVGLRLFQGMMAEDNARRRGNQARLRELQTRRTARIDVICAHDPTELAPRQHSHT